MRPPGTMMRLLSRFTRHLPPPCMPAGAVQNSKRKFSGSTPRRNAEKKKKKKKDQYKKKKTKKKKENKKKKKSSRIRGHFRVIMHRAGCGLQPRKAHEAANTVDGGFGPADRADGPPP